MQVHEHEKVSLLFGVGDKFFEVEDFRKKLFFTGSKFSIEVIANDAGTIVTYKDSVDIEHGQDIKTEIEMFEPSNVFWIVG